MKYHGKYQHQEIDLVQAIDEATENPDPVKFTYYDAEKLAQASRRIILALDRYYDRA